MGMTTRRRFRPRHDSHDSDAGPAEPGTPMAAPATPATGQAGEMDSLAELYRRHGAYVFAAAAHLVEPETAAGATRDAFLQCWHDAQSTGGTAPSREQLVAHARAAACALLLRDPRLAAVREPDRVIDLLGSLTESQAAVLTLLTVGECTFAEAASLLDRPVSQVRRQTVRGLRAGSLRLRRRGVA